MRMRTSSAGYFYPTDEFRVEWAIRRRHLLVRRRCSCQKGPLEMKTEMTDSCLLQVHSWTFVHGGAMKAGLFS
ncbi:hypothetical protein LEMLEM_LOCUS15386 [Lemmus lemmus]